MVRHALEAPARFLGELSHQPVPVRRYWHDDDSDMIASSKIMTRSSSKRVEMGLEGPFNAMVVVDDSERREMASTIGASSPRNCVAGCLREGHWSHGALIISQRELARVGRESASSCLSLLSHSPSRRARLEAS